MRVRIVVLMVATAFSMTAWGIRGDEPRTVKQDEAWVAKRVEVWQPTTAERAFDQIGWARDIREAERLGRQHRRPVFLFTYDGASLSDYRC